MNSNGDYTLCNLDSHTYTTSYPNGEIPSGFNYSAAVNHGYVDTGQFPYGGSGNSLALQGHHTGTMDLSQSHPGGASGHPTSEAEDQGPSPIGPHYEGPLHGHHSSSPGHQPPGPYSLHPGTCSGNGGPVHGHHPGQNHHHHPGYPGTYYSHPHHPAAPPGMLNGGTLAEIPHPGMANIPPGYTPYPDPDRGHNLLMSCPGGYDSQGNHPAGLGNHPQGDQGQSTATYKWMTVKRGTPKAGRYPRNLCQPVYM